MRGAGNTHLSLLLMFIQPMPTRGSGRQRVVAGVGGEGGLLDGSQAAHITDGCSCFLGTRPFEPGAGHLAEPESPHSLTGPLTGLTDSKEPEAHTHTTQKFRAKLECSGRSSQRILTAKTARLKTHREWTVVVLSVCLGTMESLLRGILLDGSDTVQCVLTKIPFNKIRFLSLTSRSLQQSCLRPALWSRLYHDRWHHKLSANATREGYRRRHVALYFPGPCKLPSLLADPPTQDTFTFALTVKSLGHKWIHGRAPQMPESSNCSLKKVIFDGKTTFTLNATDAAVPSIQMSNVESYKRKRCVWLDSKKLGSLKATLVVERHSDGAVACLWSGSTVSMLTGYEDWPMTTPEQSIGWLASGSPFGGCAAARFDLPGELLLEFTVSWSLLFSCA